MLANITITRYIENEDQVIQTIEEALDIIRKEYRPGLWTSSMTISFAECHGTYHTTPIEADGN